MTPLDSPFLLILHGECSPDLGRYADVHFTIRRNGELLEGIPTGYQANHAGILDACSIGISLTGKHHEAPTPEQVETLVALCVRLHAEFHISPNDLRAHYEVRQTADCLGPLVRVERYRRLFAEHLPRPPSSSALAA
jgi:hypothetical protein